MKINVEINCTKQMNKEKFRNLIPKVLYDLGFVKLFAVLLIYPVFLPSLMEVLSLIGITIILTARYLYIRSHELSRNIWLLISNAVLYEIVSVQIQDSTLK